ncbi:uncharacterized protein FIBRA_07149 [Fibroporia radiculosa]|uniref:Uncharacterized protein n=1 Tax=Fibroporia radiculosa TaxID=599839 RepID=J4I087_9APHY|nr:uncharacterized protein FIBRA_07149 [Fibroporia radiculosa]CCM04952.1 predicted protein [Fibroporia radiculosa]
MDATPEDGIHLEISREIAELKKLIEVGAAARKADIARLEAELDKAKADKAKLEAKICQDILDVLRNRFQQPNAQRQASAAAGRDGVQGPPRHTDPLALNRFRNDLRDHGVNLSLELLDLLWSDPCQLSVQSGDAAGLAKDDIRQSILQELELGTWDDNQKEAMRELFQFVYNEEL